VPDGSVEQGRGRRDDLRRRAARGTLVNAAFLVGLNLLALVKGFAVAAFLTVSDYGLWGLLAMSFAMLMALLHVGIADRYIQQDAEDQEAAFQHAFTLQLAVCAIFVVLLAAAMPLFAVVYDDWSIVVPGLVLALAMPGIALQAPLWTFYRDMDYLTQRRLQAWDPVVSFVVTVALAGAGAGYWSLVVGLVAGSWAGAVAAVRASPYALRVRFDRVALREHWSFSAPLFAGALSGVLIGFVPVVVAQRDLGLVAVGALAVASNISTYTTRVDEIVTNTLYPAICAVKDRADLLEESFLKSNRLALLWAVPLGAAIVLFAGDLVEWVLGPRWHVATYLIQTFGLAAAVNQIGFNWAAFFQAIGRTRPIAIVTGVMLVAVLAVALPLLLADGIDGYGRGMVIATLCLVAARLFYLRRLFSLAGIARNVVRGILPTLPAVAAVLAVRALLGGGERTPGDAIAELVVFVVLVVGATLASERALLREFRGYLRPAQPAPAA
jgi:PST family polysaccharide transporter